MQEKKLLSPETLGEILVPSNPQISPDGKYIAYTVTKASLSDNSYYDEIRVIDVDSGEEVASISQPGIGGHRWSPDSRTLIFTSRACAENSQKDTRKEVTCLYIYRLGSPSPRLVASLPFNAYSPRWLGTRGAVLTAFRKKGDADPDDDYVSTETLPLWINGLGIVADKQRHIVLVDIETGNYRWLTGGDYDVDTAEPAGDNRLVVVVTPSRLRPYIQEVRLINTESGEQKTLVSSDEEWSLNHASMTPAGLLLWGHRRPRGEASHNHVWLRGNDTTMCLSCSLGLDVSPSVQSDTFWLRGSPTQPQWTRRGAYFLANQGGRLSLYLVNPGEEPILVLSGERAIYGFTASADGERIAFTYSEPTVPGELAVYEKGRERQLTSLSLWLRSQYRLAEPKRLTVKTSDGALVEGWYLEPLTGAEAPRPVILHVHGGPKASYGPFFIFQHQLLASQGYYVVYANPRGSSGYSEDYADIRCRYGERDYKDLMEFLDAFLEATRGKSNPSRIAITGISYGGFMTNWAITQTDKFTVAISENGISWWLSDYYTSDIGYWFNPDQICGTPLENPDSYWRQSPLRYVDRVKTPVMIIHSLEDYRCFIDQALAFHTELVMRGKKSRLVVFRSGDHGFSVRGSPRQRLKRLKLIIEFLSQHLGVDKKEERRREG